MPHDFDDTDETTDSGKYRSWIFTLHHYTDEIEEAVQRIECTYLVYGREIAPTTGTPHLQGFVMFKNTIRHNTLRAMLTGKPWVRNARGTAQQNRDYCTKEKSFFEKGTLPRKGCRTDLEVARDTVMSGGNMRQVLTETSSYQAARSAELYLKYFETPRLWKTEVYWYYGATGSGKTYSAYMDLLARGAERADIHVQTMAKWWDGYDGHEYVLLDDFRDGDADFRTMLHLLDEYEHRVEQKGTTRQFKPRVIIITAPQDPTEYYKFETEDRLQFFRRITDIKHFPETRKDAIPDWFKKLMEAKKIILA